MGTRHMLCTGSSVGAVSGLGGGVSGASGLLSNSSFTCGQSRSLRQQACQRCEQEFVSTSPAAGDLTALFGTCLQTLHNADMFQAEASRIYLDHAYEMSAAESLGLNGLTCWHSPAA